MTTCGRNMQENILAELTFFDFGRGNSSIVKVGVFCAVAALCSHVGPYHWYNGGQTVGFLGGILLWWVVFQNGDSLAWNHLAMQFLFSDWSTRRRAAGRGWLPCQTGLANPLLFWWNPEMKMRSREREAAPLLVWSVPLAGREKEGWNVWIRQDENNNNNNVQRKKGGRLTLKVGVSDGCAAAIQEGNKFN